MALSTNHKWRENGWAVLHKFGFNLDLDTGDGQTVVWPAGLPYVYQTSAVAIEAVSSDAADTAEGDGARTVQIFGIDGNWDFASEVVPLDGETPVALAGTYRRINRVRIATAGDDGANAGLVSVRVASAGDLQAQVAIGESSTGLANYTIGDGWDGYVVGWDAKVDAQAGAEVRMRIKTRDNAAGAPFITNASRFVSRDDGHSINFVYPLHAPARSDISITSTASSSNSKVTAQFQLLLVPKPLYEAAT